MWQIGLMVLRSLIFRNVCQYVRLNKSTGMCKKLPSKSQWFVAAPNTYELISRDSDLL